MGRPGANQVVLVAGVEGESEPLALLDDERVAVAQVWVVRGGASLGVRVGEQQQVGDVLVAGRALLRQVVGPSKQFQRRADKLLLGDGLVGILVSLESVVAPPDAFAKRRHVGGGGVPPGRGLDALGQIVLREKLAGHVNALGNCRIYTRR